MNMINVSFNSLDGMKISADHSVKGRREETSCKTLTAVLSFLSQFEKRKTDRDPCVLLNRISTEISPRENMC